MTNDNWIRITGIENIPVREARAVQIGPLSVAIVNMGGGQFRALENRCPHGHGPLADGIVGTGFVTCPMHSWRISVETGCVVKPTGTSAPCVRTFAAKVEDGIVMLDMTETKVDELVAA